MFQAYSTSVRRCDSFELVLDASRYEPVLATSINHLEPPDHGNSRRKLSIAMAILLRRWQMMALSKAHDLFC